MSFDVKSITPAAVRRRWWRIRRWALEGTARLIAERRALRPARAAGHGLSQPVVVSLTSHRGRFATLHLTLSDLLAQSVTPDRLILWLGPEDRPHLPGRVERLAGLGLDIRTADRDLGPYTKIVPALRAHPEALLVTADDDVHYEATWLARLLRAHDPERPAVICYRAHRIRRTEAGGLAAYNQWEWNVSPDADGPDIFATGVRGVLYPPRMLDPRATDETLFLALAPGADDLWLHWMTRLAGGHVKALGQLSPLLTWRGSQHIALSGRNIGPDGLNDRWIARLWEALGPPAPTPTPP